MFKFTIGQKVCLTDEACERISRLINRDARGLGVVLSTRVFSGIGSVYTVSFKKQTLVINVHEESLMSCKSEAENATAEERPADAQFDRNSVDYLGGTLHAYQAMLNFADSYGVLEPEILDNLKIVSINLNKAIAKRDAEKVATDAENEFAKTMVRSIVASIDPSLVDIFDKLAENPFLNDIAKKS